MKKLAIVVAAYNTEKYIMECVNSILNQDKIDGWEIDLRIGIDSCEKTASVLTKNKIKFYWSEKNVGAYTLRNSLLYLDSADMYGYFDSDDCMFKNYCKKTIEANADAVMPAKINCNEKLKPIQGARIEKGGAITFTHEVLDRLGGFYGVRCAADTDFMYRCIDAGFQIAEIQEPLYYRRRHGESLTKKPTTGIGSAYRKKVWRNMCEKREQGIIKIKPTIIKLEEVRS